MASAPAYVATPQPAFAQILPADTTTLKTLVTAGSSGSKVTGLMLTSSDTADRIVQVWVTRSAVDYLLATISVPLTSGFVATIAPVSAMNQFNMPGLPIDNDGQPYILLKNGDVLKIACTTTVTAAKIIHAMAQAADF